jgi:GT2 family glycosyltransferase
MKISVIITNWNGKSILKKHLEHIINTSPEACEFIFTDDASTDDSVSYVKSLQKKYKNLKIIAHKTNQGFAQNSNNAVKKAIGDLVVLLNSDIHPKLGYISETIKHFSDPKLLGVSFAEVGHENYGKVFWKNGYIQIEPGISEKTHIAAYISGGSSIVSRELFLKLGGFDTIYKPFYFEDLDLGLRAWRSGYKLLFEPKAIVEHQHEQTISKFPKQFLIYVKERNHLLSVLRNITDKNMLWQNYFAQIGRVLTGPNYIKIILAARRQLKKSPPPKVLDIRSTKEIFDMFK